MFSVQALPNLKNGQADLVENLQIVDTKGKKLKFKNEGEGEWKTDGDQRVSISYQGQTGTRTLPMAGRH
ncbi:MAG: hypothetical protein ACK4E7_14630 [Permianibacter sp.]